MSTKFPGGDSRRQNTYDFSDRRDGERDWDRDRDRRRAQDRSPSRGPPRPRGRSPPRSRDRGRPPSPNSRPPFKTNNYRSTFPNPPPSGPRSERNDRDASPLSRASTAPSLSQLQTNTSTAHTSVAEVCKAFHSVFSPLSERAILKVQLDAVHNSASQLSQEVARAKAKYAEYPSLPERHQKRRKVIEDDETKLNARLKTNSDTVQKCLESFVSKLLKLQNQSSNELRPSGNDTDSAHGSSKKPSQESRLDALERRFNEEAETWAKREKAWENREEAWQSKDAGWANVAEKLQAQLTEAQNTIADLSEKNAKSEQLIKGLREDLDSGQSEMKHQMTRQEQHLDELREKSEHSNSAVVEPAASQHPSASPGQDPIEDLKLSVASQGEQLQDLAQKVGNHDKSIDDLDNGVRDVSEDLHTRVQPKLKEVVAHVTRLLVGMAALQAQQSSAAVSPAESKRATPSVRQIPTDTTHPQSDSLRQSKAESTNPCDFITAERLAEEIAQIQASLNRLATTFGGLHDGLKNRVNKIESALPSHDVPDRPVTTVATREAGGPDASANSSSNGFREAASEAARQHFRSASEIAEVRQQLGKLEAEVNGQGRRLQQAQSQMQNDVTTLWHSFNVLHQQYNNLTSDDMCRAMLSHVESIRSARDGSWTVLEARVNEIEGQLASLQRNMVRSTPVRGSSETVNGDEASKKRRFSTLEGSHAQDGQGQTNARLA